jgi:hypothetical protein
MDPEVAQLLLDEIRKLSQHINECGMRMGK